MIFFLLQQALRDEHRHIDVLVSRGLEHPVKDALDVLPDRIPVGTDHHAALHAGVVAQLRLFDDVGIPFGKVLVHRRDRFHHLFIVRHAIDLSLLFVSLSSAPSPPQNNTV